MDPRAALQGLHKMRLVVERACNRAMPMAFRLNRHERTRRAQLCTKPAEFVLEDRRVPEIGGGEELAAATAGHRDEVGDRPGRNTSSNGGMKVSDERRNSTRERPWKA